MKQTHLNRVVLPVVNGIAKLIPWGDVHLGAKTCNVDKAKKTLEYCLKNKIPLLGMGDMIEYATRYSVGSGVYEQVLSPQEQIDEMIEWLKPLAKAGLIIGLLMGNHENRAMKDSGVDLTKMMCDVLSVPYLGYSCYQHLRVGKQTYTVYSTHGSSNATTPAGKINAAIRASSHADVDLVLYGHTHGLDTSAIVRESIDKRNKSIVVKDKRVVLTGSYLEYRGSYGEMMGYQPLKTGSPLIIFSADEHQIRVNI